jgi:glycosyltransferase involved in cell wall biosynthesis
MANRVKLAIVIPAFKGRFFKNALDALAQQTCTLFNLYIGDDASPDQLDKVVSTYKDKMRITYTRFPENLGGKDLVKHWERCIKLTQDEEWIWLFSDDDVMDNTCVQNFYNFITHHHDADLLHLNIDFINAKGLLSKKCNSFPKQLSVSEFFSKRIKFQLNSSVVEYIFRKSTYFQNNGFINNDMAWCADDATWIKFGREKGITTIPDSKVYWRISGDNISSVNHDKKVVFRKVNANISHVKWTLNYFHKHGIADQTKPFEKVKWAISTLVVSSACSPTEKYSHLMDAIHELGYPQTKLQAITYLAYWEIKNFLLGFQKP